LTEKAEAMDTTQFSHQHAIEVLETDRCKYLLEEIFDVINEIDDAAIIKKFSTLPPAKSISRALNDLLKAGLVARGWEAESPIFQAKGYKGQKWRLDFAKETISIEIAFNHGEAIPWNLLKPVMASQLNHIEKAIQTEVGVVICATKAMKRAGNFDSAVGEYEKFLKYFQPMQAVLPTPILLIGLDAPKSFHVKGKVTNGHNKGSVVMHENY
jgi:hypothetical protein